MKCLPLPALSCEYANDVPPFERLEVAITVSVGAEARSGANEMAVEGGELPREALSQPLEVRNEATPFGIEAGGYALTPEEEGGAADTQAGSHPFQLTTTLNFNETLDAYTRAGGITTHEPSAPGLPQDLSFALPPGLVGNPNAVAQCSDVDFSTLLVGDTNLCPSDTALGVAVVTLNVPVPLSFSTEAVPVFNLVPAPGEPARFGFEVDNVPVVLDTAVLTGGDYGVVVSVKNASQAAQILGSVVTLWGVPGDPRHDQSRGWACIEGGVHAHEGEACEAPSPRNAAPFLSLPTSCPTDRETGAPEALRSTAFADSWLEPGKRLAGGQPDPTDPRWSQAPARSVALADCEGLPFSPSISVEPETHAASTPTGLTVDVHLPQQSTLEAEGKAEAAVKDTTVALPPGVQLSPAAADGLEACSEAEVGFEGKEEETDRFSATLPGEFCPNASKVGIVHIKTPLLAHELEGGVYLATQNANPFGSLVAVYIVAEDPASHVLVKLAGEVTLDEQTLQVVSTFKNTPQVPFEDLRLELFGGPRASVTTPPLCGSYTTAASFTPWSGGATADRESPSFAITAGPDGAPCSDPQPFAPGFIAQSTNPQAGAFTSFALEITRPDADQAVQSVTMHLPPGLDGMLSSVEPCLEPQAAQGTCGPASLIGQSTASAGLGSDPYTVTGGKVFITGPYRGAPFGLTIVTPAVAGPFNLGEVIVRSSISIDPYTASLTIASDPLPTQLKGIPLQLQRINVTVDRPGFEFNPTHCNPLTITGTLTGAGGASDPVSYPFQAVNCSSLPFTPRFTASTQARTSKSNGASLTVKVTSGPGQANIAKTALMLPKALPSRLTTLQKACLAKVFEANPATCPDGSDIGSATVHTPVLKNPLSGPAYLVSHGSAAFPDVEFVLQGEGITLILDGQTDIKHGITSSTFNAVPDAPISTFETTLPEGPHSALAATLPESAHGSMCATKLQMPTTITGQNGAVIRQTTKIVVRGCPKPKPKPHKHKKHKKNAKQAHSRRK